MEWGQGKSIVSDLEKTRKIRKGIEDRGVGKGELTFPFGMFLCFPFPRGDLLLVFGFLRALIGISEFGFPEVYQ